MKAQMEHLDAEIAQLKSLAAQQAAQGEAIINRLAELADQAKTPPPAAEPAPQAAPAPIAAPLPILAGPEAPPKPASSSASISAAIESELMAVMAEISEQRRKLASEQVRPAAEPVAAQPAAAEPVVAEPIAAKLAAAEPVAAEPGVAEPGVAAPAPERSSLPTHHDVRLENKKAPPQPRTPPPPVEPSRPEETQAPREEALASQSRPEKPSAEEPKSLRKGPVWPL
jgi:hypothetical protein